jgi:hypothetical protein
LKVLMSQPEIAKFPVLDREAAQTFLECLDSETNEFTFQTFTDSEKSRRGFQTDPRTKGRIDPLAKTLHGSLDQHWTTLVNLSRRGAGVFVTINRTALSGRRTTENIIAVRAYFADFDGTDIAVIKSRLRSLGLPPHLSVQSSTGGWHLYWLVCDAPLDAFAPTQERLSEILGSDSAVKDLPRVMRLPGFIHQKHAGHYFIVRLVHVNDHASYSNAEFQHASTTALAARRPSRGVHAGLASGIGIPKIDWSLGYGEGQRNNECARRAGYCFARGMTQDEALQECVKWNESNTPPLDKGEVEATVASIARRVAKKQDLRSLTGAQIPPSIRFTFDGDSLLSPPKMLIKKLLPASGIAFIGGQSGAGKTFLAVALAVSLASRTEFCGCPVRERIGVAYVVGEGAGMFALRLAAAKLSSGVKETLPFASADQVPELQSGNGIAAFIEELRSVGQEMQSRHGVRLGAIVLDTVAACFQMKDENDNAEASRICRIMRHIGESVGAVIIPVHHYGKDPATGLRGASAWRAAADVVLSVTCDIDALSGRAANHCLAISKARDAEQGALAPFILERVRLGTDDDGEPLDTCVVRYNPLGPVRRTRTNVPKGIRALDDACKIALGKYAQDIQLRKGAALIRAVELGCVKKEFFSLYVTGEAEREKANKATGRAWRRALEKLPGQYATSRAENGYEWIWLKAVQ